MPVRLLPDNRTWALDVPPDAIPLLAIPGLKAYNLPDTYQVRGYIDAVAAACRVLGAEKPRDWRDYELPVLLLLEQMRIKGEIRGYQQQGIEYLHIIQQWAQGAILADEMGLGKSRQAITLAKLRGCKRVVIVCPGRARYTWVEELVKAGESNFALMLPKGAKGWKDQRAKVATARWIITSYDLLPEIPPGPTSMLVIDEAHEIKTPSAQRSQAALSAARMVPYKLLISATPAWNIPADWWFLLELAFPGRFGKKHDFEARYCGGAMKPKHSKAGKLVGSFWNAEGVTHADELRERLSYYMVRREKREVATELPKMTDVPIWLDPDPHATSVMRAWGLRVPGITMHDALVAALESKLQTCVELAHSAKRFLLFTWQKAHAGIMSQMLNEQGTPNVLLHGDLTDAQKRDGLALAKSKQIGIVATLDYAGQSMNLQGIASYGIMHYQDPVPFKMIQARSRLHRLGIIDPVIWAHVLRRDSADEVVWRRSTSKLMAQEASMPAMQDAAEYREAMTASEQDDASLLAGYYEEMSTMSVADA